MLPSCGQKIHDGTAVAVDVDGRLAVGLGQVDHTDVDVGVTVASYHDDDCLVMSEEIVGS
jgi:hypothetical protein